jgi:hypothetical protein
MKRIFFAVAVVLFVTGGISWAEKGELHGGIGVIYSSKYVWRGFDVYDDKSAIHPFIDVDLFGTGFGINITAHRANSGEFEDTERWDYLVYYQNRAFVDEPYQMNYRFGYMYYNYPDLSSHRAWSPVGAHLLNGSIDLQELHGIFSFPNILPVKGLVPTYVLVKLWPSNSGTLVGAAKPFGGGSMPFAGTASGFAHIFMLDYGLNMTCPVTNENRVLNLHSELVYNDGVGPNGANVDHDWSDAVFGISTDIDLKPNLVFTPGIYHQITMDKSVNDDKDETWASLTLMYKF